MSYLGRIASRAATLAPAPAEGVGVASKPVPGMPSQSPLVRFDQRLTLPGATEIAAIAPSRSIEGDDSADSEGADVAATEHAAVGAERSVSRDAPQARSETISRKAVSPAAPAPPSPGPFAAPNADATSPALGDVTAGAPATRFAPFDSQPATRDEGPTEATTPAPRATPPSVELARDSNPARPREPGFAATPTSASASVELTPASSEARVEPNRGIGDARPDRSDASEKVRESSAADMGALSPVARSLFDAIARADAWVRTESPTDEPVAHAPTPTAGVFPRTIEPAIVSSSGVEASFAGEPVFETPSISIGRLEVEVVAPTPRIPAPSASRGAEHARRAVPRAPSTPASEGRRAFGWRQR